MDTVSEQGSPVGFEGIRVEDLLPTALPKSPEKLEALPILAQTANEQAQAMIAWYALNLKRFTAWIMLAENCKVLGEIRLTQINGAVAGIKDPNTGGHVLSKQKIAHFDAIVIEINQLFAACKEQFEVMAHAEKMFRSIKASLLKIKEGHESVPRDDGPCDEATVKDLCVKVDTCSMVLRTYVSRNEGFNSRDSKAETSLRNYQHGVDSHLDRGRLPMWGTNTLRLSAEELKKKVNPPE